MITATDGGPSREVSVIPAARIDAMDVVFALPGHAGGGRTLVDGETSSEGARTGNRVVGIQIPWGDLLTRSAEVIADGRCAVRVDAPAFAGGAGLGAEISVTLNDTDKLGDLTP
ncbi:hypothetical protein [Sorangium sp. So ce117]|uniref:hypothetical protein n=1 Tax=Sorangium sp. So ce117 TaxID=3133277 RepID=UPI003F616EEB